MSARAVRKRRRRRAERAAAAVVTGLLGAGGTALMGAGPAGAAPVDCGQTVGNGVFNYAGQRTNQYDWAGVERYISRPSGFSALNWNYQHLAFYLAAESESGGPYGNYQIQTGYAIGQLGSFGEVTQSLKIYGERFPWQDVPEVTFFPQSPAANNFHTVYRSAWIYGSPVYEGHVINSGVNIQSVEPTVLAPALTNGDVKVHAMTENAYNSAYLSQFPHYSNEVFYGGNNSHDYNTNWSLYKGIGGPPQQWVEWLNTPKQCGDGHDQYVNEVQWSFFKTYHI